MELSTYYEEIAHFKPLSKPAEQELFREYYQQGTSKARQNAIRDQIIKANMRFVFKMAKTYSKNDPEQFEELISAGNEGLLVGFGKFNPDSDVKFLSYAGWWVRQRILKEMSKVRVVSLPIWKQQLASKVHKYLEDHDDRTVTIEELCRAIPKAAKKDIEELYETRYLTYFLDDVSDLDEENLEDPSLAVEEDIAHENIQSVVNELPEPHKTIMVMSYGLNDSDEYSIKDIIEILDIDRKTFKTLKTEALNQLGTRLSDLDPSL